MLRIYFGAIKQYVEDESNSKDGALNDFNLGAKLAGLLDLCQKSRLKAIYFSS